MRSRDTAAGDFDRWWKGTLILTAALTLVTAQATGVWAATGYERQPVLPAEPVGLAAP